jgi:hypothetical protein
MAVFIDLEQALVRKFNKAVFSDVYYHEHD